MASVCENLHQRIAPVLERDREVAERSRAEPVGPDGRERRLAFAARETQRLREASVLGEPLECIFRTVRDFASIEEAFKEFQLSGVGGRTLHPMREPAGPPRHGARLTGGALRR